MIFTKPSTASVAQFARFRASTETEYSVSANSRCAGMPSSTRDSTRDAPAGRSIIAFGIGARSRPRDRGARAGVSDVFDRTFGRPMRRFVSSMGKQYSASTCSRPLRTRRRARHPRRPRAHRTRKSRSRSRSTRRGGPRARESTGIRRDLSESAESSIAFVGSARRRRAICTARTRSRAMRI